MKIIRYKFLCAEINHGTEEKPNIERIFADKEIRCATADVEVNEAIAKAEAYNGVFAIEDDGIEEVTQPTQDERIKELEEALDMLLSGVTE